MIITWSRCEHGIYFKIGQLTIDWGEVGRVGKHFHILKNMLTSCSGSNRKAHICSSCEEVLALTWLFSSNWWVTCGLYGKIFELLYFIWKLVFDKARTYENQRTVLQIFLSENGVLTKMWIYKILWIPLKFSRNVL